MLSNRHGNLMTSSCTATAAESGPHLSQPEKKPHNNKDPRAARNKYSNLKEKNRLKVLPRETEFSQEIQFQRNHKLKLKQLKGSRDKVTAESRSLRVSVDRSEKSTS